MLISAEHRFSLETSQILLLDHKVSVRADLDKVGAVAIVIDTPGIEPRSCPFPAKSRDERKGGDGGRPVCWRCRQRHREDANIALDSQYLHDSKHDAHFMQHADKLL